MALVVVPAARARGRPFSTYVESSRSTVGSPHAVEALDHVKPLGRPAEVASVDATSAGKSAAETAEKIGVSQATVERTRAVQTCYPRVTGQPQDGGSTGAVSTMVDTADASVI